MMDVEGDDGHGGGKGDQADGDPVIQSCDLNSDFFWNEEQKSYCLQNCSTDLERFICEMWEMSLCFVISPTALNNCPGSFSAVISAY